MPTAVQGPVELPVRASSPEVVSVEAGATAGATVVEVVEVVAAREVVVVEAGPTAEMVMVAVVR